MEDDRPEDILVLRPYGDNGEASVLSVDNRARGGEGFDLPSSLSLLDVDDTITHLISEVSVVLTLRVVIS